MGKIHIENGIISSSADYGLYRGTSQIVNIQDGEFRVLGDLIAENYIVSSSVTSLTYQSLSGSTIFGDSSDDTHTFIGNTISGSSTSTGSFGRVMLTAVAQEWFLIQKQQMELLIFWLLMMVQPFLKWNYIQLMLVEVVELVSI